jgi:hypothetical protein
MVDHVRGSGRAETWSLSRPSRFARGACGSVSGSSRSPTRRLLLRSLALATTTTDGVLHQYSAGSASRPAPLAALATGSARGPAAPRTGSTGSPPPGRTSRWRWGTGHVAGGADVPDELAGADHVALVDDEGRLVAEPQLGAVVQGDRRSLLPYDPVVADRGSRRRWRSRGWGCRSGRRSRDRCGSWPTGRWTRRTSP